MYVVVSVSVDFEADRILDGGAIGPFATEDQAYDWADEHWGDDTDWAVTIVSSPED